MNHRYVALTIFACTFATLSPLRTLAAPFSPVVLSEIQWSGSALSTADEWIELANTSSESVDISSWKITGVASQGAEIVIPPETVLTGYATYLIANYALGDAKTVLTVSPDLVTSSLSLSNSSLSVSLAHVHGTVVDTYASLDAGSVELRASAERDLATGEWFTATTARNILAEGTLGSPGYALFTDTSLLEDEMPENSHPVLVEEIEMLDEEPDAAEDIPVQESEATESVIELVIEPATENLPPPEEEIAQDEVIDTEAITDASLETDDFVQTEDIEIEVVTLITPITTETIVSVVEETKVGDPSYRRDDTNSVTTPEEPSKLNVSQPEEELSALQETAPVTEVEPVVTLVHVDYSPLRVTEFVSDPQEGSEWVELWNSGALTLSLEGVVLTDASLKATPLVGSIEAGAYVLIENPKGKLNNTGDDIVLTLPDGQTLFTLTYGTEHFPAPKKGVSAGMCDDGWRTDLTPSPAAQNLCPLTIIDTSYATEISTPPTLELGSTSSGASSALQGAIQGSEDSSSSSSPLTSVTTSVVQQAASSSLEKESSTSSTKNKSTSGAAKTSSKNDTVSVSIDALESLPSGQRVSVQGTIVVEPGILGKRIAYLNGVQLYFHKATWPLLPVDTLVQIVGTWDYDGDSRRIKIADALDIEIIGSETAVPLSWDDVSAETMGDILVTASGTLIKKEQDTYIFSSLLGKDFYVIDEAKTGSLTLLRAGDKVTLTGMLFPYNGTWIIAPRSADDLVILKEEAHAEISAPLPSSPLSVTPPPAGSAPIIGGGILMGSVSALGYWFLRTKKLLTLFS